MSVTERSKVLLVDEKYDEVVWHGPLEEFFDENEFDEDYQEEIFDSLATFGIWVTGGGASPAMHLELVGFQPNKDYRMHIMRLPDGLATAGEWHTGAKPWELILPGVAPSRWKSLAEIKRAMPGRWREVSASKPPAARVPMPNVKASDLDGLEVKVAFNLAQCAYGKPRRSDYCYTIAVLKGRTFGKVLAYTDAVLVEDPEFVVNPAGIARIRKGKRTVAAWVQGVIRDPKKAKRLGKVADWDPLTICPFTDDAFMIPVGKNARCIKGISPRERPGKPLHEAQWAFFDVKGTRDKWHMLALAKCARACGGQLRKNPARRVEGLRDLKAMASEFGGEIYL